MATTIPTTLGPTLTPTIDPTRAKECFYMANIDYPRYSNLTPDMAAEMLTKAMNLINQITFSFLYIDRPADGQVYLISLPPTVEELPPDGFHYLDNEMCYKTTLPDGRELLCAERKGGFAPNDQFTSKIRRRYRLSMGNDNLQLLHYVKLEENHRQILNPGVISRTPTRKYPTPQMQPNMSPYARLPQQSPMQGHVPNPQVVHLVNSTAPPTPTPSASYVQFQSRASTSSAILKGVNTSNSKSTGRRGKSAKNKAAAAAAAAEEADDPSGDEFDNIKPRDVALARYKMNHDFIEEIFSPHSTSSIKLEPSPYETLNIDELKQKVAENKAAIETTTNLHAEKINNFKERSAAMFRSVNDIKNCSNIEEIENLQKTMEKNFNLVIRPRNPLRVVELNNVPEESDDVINNLVQLSEDGISNMVQLSEDGINNMVQLPEGGIKNMVQLPENLVQPLQQLPSGLQLNHLELSPYVIQQNLVMGNSSATTNLEGMLDIGPFSTHPDQLVYDELDVLAMSSHISMDGPMEDRLDHT
ncbi:hypothetical protein G9A89_013504 [Geosiphon pyriformis]|nr:hypothetical protein G9A89_013504 [Geosiphon pyriformis]